MLAWYDGTERFQPPQLNYPNLTPLSKALFSVFWHSPRARQARPIQKLKRMPNDLPEFNRINRVLWNLKTSLGAAYSALDLAK